MKIILPIVLTLLFMSCQHSKEKVDLIVENATIYNVDSAFSKAAVMAVENGEIIAIGHNEVLKQYESDKHLDLKGKFVYPGLIDAHCHFVGYSMNLRQVDLVGTNSFQEIVNLIVKWDETHDAEWILGRGWDQNDWAIKEYPDNEKLNKLFPDKPIFLRRIDGHAAIANAKALEIAGIDRNTRIEGGKVITKDGKPTGVLIDNAMGLVRKHIGDAPVKEKVALLNQGAENCFKVGLTTVVDAGLYARDIDLLDSLQRKGELLMQVYAMLSPTQKNFEQYMERGVYKTSRLHVHSVKLYADGALGSRGACMLEPYSDDEDNNGLIVTDPERLEHIARKAYNHNYQVNTHAIGDSANRLVLELYGKVLPQQNDRRWRIEHAQVIHKDDFDLFGQYNVVPAVNTTHATSDMYWADERLGEKRLKNAYAYKKLLEQNGWLCNGSDFPVEDIHPLYGFYAAVARKDKKDYPENGFQTENALSRKEALKAMTIWAAKSIFEEDIKGSLEPGKQADFVVLEKDIMSVPLKEIPGINAAMTFIQGELVFNTNAPQ